MTNSSASLHEGCIVSGSLFSEPMHVVTVQTDAAGNWTVGLVGGILGGWRSWEKEGMRNGGNQ